MDRACSACSILRASDGLWFRYRQRQERICRIGRRFGSTGNKSGESAVKKSEERIIRITAGSHVIHAKLYDNAAARALWDKMPVTYSMQNLYNREMCFRMGAGSLPTKEAKDTGYKVGDISYWPPMGSLVILYSQNGEVFEQQPIGHTDDDISFFANMGTTPIIFEKSEV